jgi:hypothetical protein
MKITRSKVIGLALNLKDACDFCHYCWNSTINEKFHPDRIGSTHVDKDFDQLIEQIDRGRIPKPVPEETCQFYKNSGRDLLLGAKAEFFHPDASDVALCVLNLLSIYPDVISRARILTKRNIYHIIPVLPQGIWVGATITTLSDKVSKIIQPKASQPNELIEMLQEAHDLGFPTWCVVEPFLRDMHLWSLIEKLDFVKELWVGRLNGGRNVHLPYNDTISRFMGKKFIYGREDGFAYFKKIVDKHGKPVPVTVGHFAEKDQEILQQYLFAEKTINEAVVQQEVIRPDGKAVIDHSQKFDFVMYPKKEVKRLLEKAGYQ